MQAAAIPQAFEVALDHHRHGRLTEAEVIYREIVAVEPRHADALHNLGVIAHQVGRNDVAVEMICKAIALVPGAPWFHSSLGVALEALGRNDEAIAAYRRAIELEPGNAQAHYNLGGLLTERGYPDEGVAAYRRAIECKPDFADAYNNLGRTMMEQGQLNDAICALRRAVQLKPGYAMAHSNLGDALRAAGQLDEAVASCRRAILIQPDYGEAHNNLGNALNEQGHDEEAFAAYQRAIQFKPGLSSAQNNLGNAFTNQGRIDEAVAAYRRAIELRPAFAEAHNNLGIALKNQGRLDEAIAMFRKAIELRPDDAMAHSNLIFTLDLVEGEDLAGLQNERRRWYEQHAARFAAQIVRHGNERDPGRRLRVGYVSADFCRHSACDVFGPVVRGHEAAGFEVHCYSGVKREDDATERLRRAVQGWRSTLGMSDEELAGQIRRDGIDILVDLSGHSAGNRLLVFARKPAPVQVTAWGHATGTGMKTMDYFFADAVVVPEKARALYTETVIDLPCVLCYEPPEYLPEVGMLPAMEGNPLTYGCVNRLEKITDRVIGMWGRILRGTPGARLLLKDKGLSEAGVRREVLGRLLGIGGIEESRVLLIGASPHAEHLKIFERIDVGLDPYPQNGGVSTAEALWMGVPVVTLQGATEPSRMTASMSSLVGLADWAAESEAEYVDIALRAGRELGRVAELRKELRGRLKATPFGDVRRYTLAVEHAYRQMWRAWCDKQRSLSPS
jgi:predicted O-linked N-acetylglucosamine transferase (SPINDLY family)